MTDQLDNPQNSNNSTSPEDIESSSLANQPLLPDFDSTPAEANSPDIPVKTSEAAPPNLNHLFTGEPPPEDIETSPTNPVYKISSAEADLSNNYPLPDGTDDEATKADDENSPSGWQTTWAIVKEVGETIILTLVIFLVIQLFVRNFRVVGTSMVGNLHDGQYLIIDKMSYNPYVRDYLGIGGPDRGDVIVFKPPRNPNDDYVKRVIGLPGEKVQVISGQVHINDEPLDETFAPKSGSYSMQAPVVVPEGQLFVLGDNRNNSNDSHNWGPLPMENIVGRAWISYWPPDQWGIIPSDAPTEEATVWYLLDQIIPTANAQND